jgi:hypothetical protein
MRRATSLLSCPDQKYDYQIIQRDAAQVISYQRCQLVQRKGPPQVFKVFEGHACEMSPTDWLKSLCSSRYSCIGGKNRPRVPTLPKYGGNQDTKEFEHWLNHILQWLKVNKICRSENDSDWIEYTAMFLENNTLSWFKDNIDSVYHQQTHWTFQMW